MTPRQERHAEQMRERARAEGIWPPRSKPPECHCGECHRCKHRFYMRRYRIQNEIRKREDMWLEGIELVRPAPPPSTALMCVEHAKFYVPMSTLQRL